MPTLPMPLWEPIGRPRNPSAPKGSKDRYEGLVTDAWVKYLTTQADTAGSSTVRLVTVSLTGQAASIGATALDLGSLSAGLYEVKYYARITRAATASSSLTVTFAWTDGGTSPSYSGAAITGNTTTTVQSGAIVLRVDSASPITYATTYASVGATTMQHSLYIVALRLDA